uniref:Reverse transcriptase Ty1/copia-type domain-containing protein n=1 Tax=Cannabis sativa TaxID=3483 RepID=A0A803NIU9_CANSA
MMMGPGLVAWEHVCIPKSVGGLGLRDIQKWNTTTMTRYVWDIASKKDCLFVKWIHNGYLKDRCWWDYEAPTDCNWFWKKLVGVKNQVKAKMDRATFIMQKFNISNTYQLLFSRPEKKDCKLKGISATRRSMMLAMLAALVYQIWGARNDVLWNKKQWQIRKIVNRVQQERTYYDVLEPDPPPNPPITKVLDYSKLSPTFKAFICSISSHYEPQYYHEAAGIPEWDSAMDIEIEALEKNGIDYSETFASVIKLVTVKLILALAAVFGWHLHQLDVNNAFLHGDLHEDVYMTLPQGKNIGKLQYLTITPDLSFLVNKLSQYLGTPRASHFVAAQRVLQYVKGIPGQGIFFSAQSKIELEAYTDLDWAACLDTRRSTTELKIEHKGPVLMHCDNKAAQHIAANLIFHEITKHIEIDSHLVREKVQQGIIKTAHISTKDQIANLLTKALFPG